MTSSEGTAPAWTALEPTLAVRLVLGVARLGEADLEGWWSSQGMNPAVRFTLAGFRRTATIVGAELAVLSATRRHRQILPRTTAVHLFSPHVPFAAWTRAYLAEHKSSGKSPIVEELLSWTAVDAARAQLEMWLGTPDFQTGSKASVRAIDLVDPAVVAGLLVRFIEGYIDQLGDLSIPYVDLAP